MSAEDPIRSHSNAWGQSYESDEQKLQFNRSIGVFDSFASSFCAVNFVGSVRILADGTCNLYCTRVVFFLGILARGPLAMWSSFLINCLLIWITAAILGEICSALPISGSVYIWAAEAAGMKYGRLVGFIVAWWAATSWMTFVATTSQGTANYVVSLIAVFGLDFPGGISNDNVKWRALVWIVSEICLVISIAINYLPNVFNTGVSIARWYSVVLRGTFIVMLLDFILCLIWLPIAASRTYGLRTPQQALLTTYNGTGASTGWNWMLSFLFTSSILVGFDAAGHIAEETKDASTVAARSIFRSSVATGVGGFITTILFLFCTPDIGTLFSLNAPQPFVLIYDMALGRGGCVFMTVLTAVEALLTMSILVLAASRIIFAIGRDGTLPLSSWVGKVTPNGRPQNAVAVIFGFCAILLCTILPSAVAFTSLMSAGVVPIVASYGLIAFLRLVVTPDGFKSTKFSLGRGRKLFYAIAAALNAVLMMVLVSPFSFPVTASSFNFGGVIFVVITIFGFLSFWFTPEKHWLSRKHIEKMYNVP